MLFKYAITIVKGPYPYVLNVAIPDGNGKFIVHEFKHYADHEALSMGMDYFHEFRKRPETILEYHKKIVEDWDAKMKQLGLGL